jgi:copper homeostasis protein
MNNQPINNAVSLEVCANSVASAIAAQDGGAVRVELCANLNEGGTTPSYGEILLAREYLNIKLFVLIRPRAGDFLYSDTEFNTMLADVKCCIEAGCDGVVTGILNADGTIDKARCSQIIALAAKGGLGVTFHRAFDLCADQYQGLEDVIEVGCERILTSGGKSTAIEGAAVIANLIAKATGRIVIMPGSGINEANVNDLLRFTTAKEIHSSARTVVKSKMNYQNDHIFMGDNRTNAYNYEVTDAERVKKIIKAANEELL